MIQLIFKADTPTNPANKITIGDTNFKEHYMEVNRNMLFSELKTYIRQATERYVLPFIGVEIYNDIAAKYHNNDPMNLEQKMFLQKIQDTVAYYTIRHAYPKKRTVLASMGVVENTPKDGSTNASAVAYKQTLWDVTLNADYFLDDLVAFMEEEVNKENAYFDLWKNSKSYTSNVDPLFRLTCDFNKHFNIHQSRRTLQAFYPSIKLATKKYLIPILCKEQYDELANQFKGDTLTDENRTLLQLSQEMLAFWTVYEGIDMAAVVIEADGIRAISSDDGQDKRASVLAVFKDSIAGIKWKCEENGRTLQQDLIQFLNNNTDKYPTWKASDCNQNAENCECSKHHFINGRGALML